MEIYNKLYETIENINTLKLQLNLPIKFIEFILSNIAFPSDTEFKKVIYLNPNWSLKILSRYKKITYDFIENDIPFEKLIQYIENIKFDYSKTKPNNIDTFILIDKQIKKFLIEQNFFQKCYDELGISSVEITQQDIIEYKNQNQIIPTSKFKYRKNQLEVITHLRKNGIVTGIHCEATGCGKSIEILLYIAHCLKLNPKCKIILFTERVSILADLFDFKNVSNPVDSANVKFWKENEICDLSKFDIIDRVTIKKSDWIKILNKATGPTLLVINRAYLTLTDEYKNIEGLNLILHDECHNVASNKCFNFLKYIKTKQNVDNNKKNSIEEKEEEEEKEKKEEKKDNEQNNKSDKKIKSTKKYTSIEFDDKNKNQIIPIVGFSATPLRAGKTKSGDEKFFNKDRLIEIYGKTDEHGQLNLITNYNMIYAISEDLILAPQFHWFNIDSYQTKTKKNDRDKDKDINKNKLISKPEIGSVMKILDELLPKMPNRKLVAWCGTIPLCDNWYELFDEYKSMYENLKDIKIYKDYSKKNSDDILGYDKFKYIESDGIMFCAQKHREGSDIIKLDGCIFLDKVKNRGAIPFIQSIGRVLRKENNKQSKKVCGYIIDGVIRNDNEYEKNIVDKILGYYFALSDIASIDDIVTNTESNYSKYVKLMDLIEFEPDEKKIKLKLDKTTIEINCKKLDWNNIVENFKPILEKKVGLNENDKIYIEFEQLKKNAFELNKKINGINLISNWKDYALINKIEIEPNLKYNLLWKGWYDFFQIDISKFPKTKIDWIKKCKKYNLHNDNYYKKIYEFKLEDMPEFPNEIYNNFTNIKKEFEDSKNIKII